MDIAVKLVGAGVLALLAVGLVKVLFGVVFGLVAMLIGLAIKVALFTLLVWVCLRIFRSLRRPEDHPAS